MNILSPVALPAAPVTRASSILAVALHLLDHLERGQRIDAAILRAAMEAAFGASDTGGAWDWKAAYEACEVATVLFLRKYGNALSAKPHLRLHVSGIRCRAAKDRQIGLTGSQCDISRRLEVYRFAHLYQLAP